MHTRTSFSLTSGSETDTTHYDRCSRTVCLGIKHLSGDHDRFILLGCVDVGRFLWQEDGSVVYNCCWSSSAQPFSRPSPLGLTTIFYCLRFETSLFVSSYDSQVYGGGIRSLLHAGYLWLDGFTFIQLRGGQPEKITYPRRRVFITQQWIVSKNLSPWKCIDLAVA
jgi:hypothetical protein